MKTIKELKLSKVNEVSLCTTFCPPANGLKAFEIVKSSIKKDLYSDLFEEMESPEYGDFVAYLDMWLEDDVNMVAYSAFLDALFNSIQDVVYMDMTKEEKAVKFKEIFDKFIEEYDNSVITKSDDGKVKLSIKTEKQEKKMSIIEKLKKFVSELSEVEVEKTEEAVEAPEVIEAPGEVLEEKPEDQQIVEENLEVVEPITEEVLESEDATPETVEEAEVVESLKEKVEEVIEAEPIAEVADETPEVIEEVEKTEIVEDEITKATNKISELEAKLEEISKANQEQEIKLEKAEILKEVGKEFYGLPQTKEEVVEVLFELNKSSISEESKKLIKDSLKSLSELNKASFEEIGHSEEVDANKTDKEKLQEKTQKLMEEHSLVEGQAHLVAIGKRDVKEAIRVSEIVKSKKR